MAVLHVSTSGAAYPDDLKLLKEIYDDICERWGLHCGSRAAEDLARATMDLFAQGMFDENEIRESLEEYLSRRSAPGTSSPSRLTAAKQPDASPGSPIRQPPRFRRPLHPVRRQDR